LRSLLDGALAGAAAGVVRSGAAGLSEAFAGELPPVIGEAYSPASVERRSRARRTESLKDVRRHLRLVDPESEPLAGIDRPRTRGECVDGPRPCPWVSCRHSLYLEVNAKGGLRYVYPEREPEDMPAEFSCSLDVADRGGVSRVELADLLRLTPERTRQLVDSSIGKLRGAKGIEALAEDFDGVGEFARGDCAERPRAEDAVVEAVVEPEPPAEPGPIECAPLAGAGSLGCGADLSEKETTDMGATNGAVTLTRCCPACVRRTGS